METQPCAAQVIRSTGPAPAGPPQQKAWILAVAVLGSTMAFIDESVVNVALPRIELELHTTLASMQWVVNAYTLCMSALLLIGGAAVDTFGRRRMFLAGLIAFAIASTVCGFAPNAPALIAARVVQGAAAALLIPCALAIIGAAYDEHERGAAIGIWSGASALAGGAGPMLGGLLVDHVSWRAIFFINPLIAVPTFIIALRRLPESVDPTARGGLDWTGAVLVFGGLGALVFGLIDSSTLGWRNPVVDASLTTGVLLLVAFVWQEARTAVPMMPLRLFHAVRFSGINVLTVLLYGALGGAFFFLPFLLIQGHGFSAAAAGAVFIPFALVLALLSRWSGRLIDRFGARRPLIIGSLVVAGGFASLAFVSGALRYWIYLVPMTVMGFGMSIVITPLTTVVIDSVEKRETGLASGINNVAAAVAGLLAIAVLGTLVGSSPVVTARLVMTSAAVLALGSACVAALTIHDRRPTKEPVTDAARPPE